MRMNRNSFHKSSFGKILPVFGKVLLVAGCRLQVCSPCITPSPRRLGVLSEGGYRGAKSNIPNHQSINQLGAPLVHIFFWWYSKLLFKAFGKVSGVGETHLVGYFRKCELLFKNHTRCNF